MTRRELIGMASVGVVAIAFAGRYAVRQSDAEAPVSHFPVHHSDAQWRAMLGPASYHVLRRKGTEKPFSSPLLAEHRQGVFACAGCGKPLFQSRAKYDSHTGWPSFWEAIAGAVTTRDDGALGMSRTEVRCVDCGGHLGHLFTDGPKPTGLRYCMNGLALKFLPTAA